MDDKVIMDRTVELKNMVIYQHQIPGQYWGACKEPYKIVEKGRKVDTYWEEKESKIKSKEILPTGGGETTILEIWNIYMHLYGHGVCKNKK